MERQCWSNSQYSRWVCLDITAEAGALEEKVVNIFGKLNCNIPSNCIEACHGVGKKTSTVNVKFSRRKD